MARDQLRGSLRDFRIDVAHQEVAHQQVASPGALTEWTREDSDFEEDLSSWNQDLNQELEAPTKQSVNLSQTIAPPQPAQIPRAEAPHAPMAARAPLQANTTKQQPPPPPQQRMESESFGPMPWSEELALNELRAERQGEVEVANAYQRPELLRRRTREFVMQLRDLFKKQIELFNAARKSPASTVHLYRVSQTAEDFMLFRNGVKLMISGQRSGKILLVFNQGFSPVFNPSVSNQVELEASWGAFDQLHWTYKGERLQVSDVVRFFMTEFVRNSAR